MKLLLLLSISVGCYANVCTPLTASAQGAFPAIPANGVDGLSWSIARVNWTSDATSGTPSTQQQVIYASATEWASAPNVYPHTTGQITQTTSSNTAIQNAIVSNLLPNMVYHFKPQSYQGGAWCTVSDQTFTTLAKPNGLVLPTLPQVVPTTRPTLSGTHWVYGSNCGTTSGTTYAIVTANLSDCLNNHMNFVNGDDLALPPQALGGPAAYPISLLYIHQSENAVNLTVSGSTFTQAGSAPANGTQVIIGGAVNYSSIPSPINPGVPYYVVNSSGSTFQLSNTSGGSPITLLNAGSNGFGYLPYPITQPRAAIHSTASASQLPPVGVRLGPDALAQYYPYMPNLEAVDPVAGAHATGYLQLSPLTANLTWENIRFSVDPTVATSGSAVDPPAFNSPIVNVALSLNGIVWDQCAFDPGPPPNRVQAVALEGTNMAIINSYIRTDFPTDHLFMPGFAPPTISGNTITIPAFTWSYVGPSGAKVSCPNAGGTITVASGTTSGNMVFFTNPNCSNQIIAPTGITVTTTIPGTTVSTAASPAFPTSVYTAPLGGTITTHAAMNYNAGENSGAFNIVSGVIQDTNTTLANYPQLNDPGSSTQASEGAIGITLDGYGPFLFDNNYILGSAIGGVFMAEGLTLSGTVCGAVNPCDLQTVVGNMTVTRNTMTVDAIHWNYDSASWDGGNRYWRNVGENKNGRFTLWDGNIIGPYYAQVGEGQCGLHESFTTSWIQSTNYPPVNSSSDWTYTNNTCINMPSTSWGTSYTFVGTLTFPYPLQNFLIRNNLALNNNAYAQVPANSPYSVSVKAWPTNSTSTCPQGIMSGWIPQENLIVDHNTVSGQGGCLPFWMTLNEDLPSMTITNNILNLVNDPYFWGSGTTGPGMQYASDSYSTNSCITGNTVATVFPCIHNLQWAGNLMLPTWSNSYPGSQVDFTTSQITGTIEPYFAGFATNFCGGTSCSPGNTLAARQANIGWLNLAAGNFRLANSSPFISGNTHSLTSPSTDGLSVGVDMDKLEAHQFKVSNLRVLSTTSTSLTLGWFAAGGETCGVDWGTTAFYNGTGTWTRVAGSAGTPDPRVQSLSVTGVTAHALVYYRLNCAVQQPTGTVQLP